MFPLAEAAEDKRSTRMVRRGCDRQQAAGLVEAGVRNARAADSGIPLFADSAHSERSLRNEESRLLFNCPRIGPATSD